MEKWQEALGRWDTWSETVARVRADITAKHGNVASLVAKARMSWPDLEDGEIKSFKDVTPTGNKEGLILWELHDEVRDTGEKFIRETIGLAQSSYYFYYFLNDWLYSIVPEIIADPSAKLNIPEEELAAQIHTPVWSSSKVIRLRDQDLVVDSVSWFRNLIDPNDVAELIKKKRWPTAILVDKRRTGRPRETDRIGCEAIVCAILKDKQNLTNKEITELFGWDEQTDEYGKPKGSRTVIYRIKQGKRIPRPVNQ